MDIHHGHCLTAPRLCVAASNSSIARVDSATPQPCLSATAYKWSQCMCVCLARLSPSLPHTYTCTLSILTLCDYLPKGKPCAGTNAFCVSKGGLHIAVRLVARSVSEHSTRRATNLYSLQPDAVDSDERLCCIHFCVALTAVLVSHFLSLFVLLFFKPAGWPTA